MENNSEYSTSDLGLSSFLLAKGYTLKSYRSENGRMWFTFVSDDATSDDVASFFSGKDDEISANAYRQAERKLFRIIHDTPQSSRNRR